MPHPADVVAVLVLAGLLFYYMMGDEKMTHKEFHMLAAKVAAGRYFTTIVEVSTHTTGRTQVEYKAYVDGVGWSKADERPEEALEHLAILSAGVQRQGVPLDAVDPMPEKVEF